MRKKISFLIVDDSAVMRRMIRRVIREYAVEINECEDGAVALSAYERHKPDWILMAVELGEKDGLTATREICGAYPEAHIVIVTDHGDAETRTAAEKAGARGFVAKENLLDLQRIISNRIDY